MSETKPKRPGIVLAAAILLFVFGGFGLFGLCAVFTPFLQDMIPQPPQIQGQPRFEDPMKKIAQEVPSFNIVHGAVGFTMFALSILQIWAGFGLLKLRPAARIMAIATSFAIIVLMIGQTIYDAIFFIPVYTRLLDVQVQNLGPMPFDIVGFTKGFMWVSLSIGLVFGIGIRLTIILMVNTKSARNAFAGISDAPADEPEPEPRRRYDGYDDDDEAYPRSSPQSPGDTGITNRDS